MRHCDCGTKRLLAASLVLAPLLAVCVLYLDVPVAILVKTHLYRNARWSALTSNLPDLLLVLVVLVTVAGLLLYRFRSKKGICDTLTMLAKLVSWMAPVSYLLKNVLKFVFGRVNTRVWLGNYDFYGFHWFDGGSGFEGFPSGHMLVVVSLLAALCRFYPRWRGISVAVAVSLGAALIATNYHFVSDVIAGVYCGLLVESLVACFLPDEPRCLPLPAID